MSVKAYHGKTVVVVGAGLSGIAATEFLLENGARVVLTDSKSEETLSNAIASLRTRNTGRLALELGGHKRETFGECDLLVVSPGVPLALPIFELSRSRGIPVVAEVELAYRHLQGKILAITGSNGKTTTTTLVAELLRGSGFKAYAAGNLGAPLIGFAAHSAPEDIYAVEMSSFQLEGIRDFRPHVGALLNLTPDHLDRYPGFEEYAAAKERIFMNQGPAEFAVLNADDQRAAALAGRISSSPVLFSRRTEPDRGVFLRAGRLIYRDGAIERVLFPADSIRLKGDHNAENVLAACTVALLAGAAPEGLEAVVRRFRGVEHRLEWVAEIDGVEYYNDSKATNVDAAIKALEAFPGGIHLIAGGRDKGGDFAVLRPLVAQRVKRLVLLGEAAGKIRQALQGAAEIGEAADLPEAVQICRRQAMPGDVVLLAPACASFDMFRSFEHRGRVFKEAVHALSSRS
jgi:UDP-N-acetylmuramoylalanine--D-glutamate ligase